MKVDSPSKYEGRFPHFSEPHEIGCFSLDCDRKYCDDKHQLKYIVMPRRLSGLCMDLNNGYSKTIKKDFGKTEKLNTLLKWIVSHQERVKQTYQDHLVSSNLKMSFVCFRGLLTAVSATIYENKEDWLICATKFRSVIYLCAFDTEQDINRREKMTEREKLMCSWGYKFEQYMTADSVNGKPNTSVPVNEKEEFCSVMKGKLGNHTILFSAEVDGEDPAFYNNPNHNPTSMQQYVELKTSRIISNERQHRNFCRYKLIKWWLQSFLAGVPQIVCGFRDDDGIVRDLEVFKVQSIPKLACDLWSPAACFNFCCCFLDYVKYCVVKDDPHVVYKFYWKPGSDITCEELDSPSEYQILPEWYLQNLTLL